MRYLLFIAFLFVIVFIYKKTNSYVVEPKIYQPPPVYLFKKYS